MTLSLFDLDRKEISRSPFLDGENIQNVAKTLIESATSFLFLNDQLPINRRNQIWIQLQACIAKKSYFESPCFLVPTSGTTSSDLKVVIVKKVNFLNAARKVNLFLNSTMEDSWLVSLPLHHVGGLSILARSFLETNKVFYFSKWQPDSFIKTLNDLDIAFCSLVPTQVFDLADKRVPAQLALKRVLVGGSALADSRFAIMRDLGWPLVKTYGMTETSAFICTSSGGDVYEPLPGIDFMLDSAGLLAFCCDSLFEGYLRQQADQWTFKPTELKNGFWSTEDRAIVPEMAGSGSNGFKLLGRDQNMIKINGELVNLTLLNDRLSELVQAGHLPAGSVWIHFVPSERAENELVAVFSELQNEVIQKTVIQKFNQLVLPFERINWYVKVPEISRTEMGKVRLSVFNSESFKESYFENRKNILD